MGDRGVGYFSGEKQEDRQEIAGLAGIFDRIRRSEGCILPLVNTKLMLSGDRRRTIAL